MKTKYLFYWLVFLFLIFGYASSEEIASKKGLIRILANLHGSENSFKIEGMRISAHFSGSSINFIGDFEFCLINKNPDEIQDPSQYEYKRTAKGQLTGIPSLPYVPYDEYAFEKGLSIIIRKAGNRYLAMKPQKLLPVYKWSYEVSVGPNKLQEAFKKWEAENITPRKPTGGGMDCLYKYWPNVAQNPIIFNNNNQDDEQHTKTYAVHLKETFRIPGSEKKFIYWWEKPATSQNQAQCCTLQRGYISFIKDGSEVLEAKTDTLCTLRVFSSANEGDILGRGGNDFAGVFGGENKPFVLIELVSINGEQVVYRLKFTISTDEEKQKFLAEEKIKNQPEELKRSAGVRSAKISDSKKFYLAGVRFSWDVGDNNTLSLNHEIALRSTDGLEFALLKQGELEDIDISLINFKELTSEPVVIPLNGIGIFRSNKGCVAIKPTKVEDGGKAVRGTETIVTKMVTCERRVWIYAEPKGVAQSVTQNR